MKRQRLTRILCLALLIQFVGLPEFLYTQGDFYKGKTITVVQGRDPGGTGDIRVKAVLPFLQKYIPGHPTILSEYMPGGGSRKAANFIFKSAQPDGLTIGNAGSGMVAAAVLGEQGVFYDVDKFIYLGSPFSSHQAIFVTRKEAGLNSLEKLGAAAGIRIGAQSVGFSTYIEGRLFAYIIGLKEPRFVTGYSGAELDPAIMRGELDARATSADTVFRRNPEWLEKNLVDFHATLDVPKGDRHARFTHLPELEDLAKSEKDRQLLTMQRAFRVTGQPFIAPPGVPKERAETLRQAFIKTYQDPEFHKSYKKLAADDATPLLPDAHEKVIREIPRDAEIVATFKQIIGAGLLPPRQ